MVKQSVLNMFMCCLLFIGGSTMTFSQDEEFNPTNPEEPSAANICRLTVSADPEEGAYVSGGGKYTVNGNSVYISSSARNTEDYTYTFLYWTINGEKTSYSQDFYYTPQTGKYDLVAHYEKKEVIFDPSNPNEPSASNVKRKYYLYINSSIEGACSFNIASGDKHEEQSEIYLYAYLNAGYRFDGWKLNGTIVSTDLNYYFNMPSANSTLEACISEIPFDPENPIEPNGSSTNVDNSGRKVINLTIGSTDAEVDNTRIAFNEKKTLGYDTGTDASKFVSTDAAFQIYSLDSEGRKYAVNERPTDNGNVPLGIIVKTAGKVTISATRLDCSIALVDKLLDKKHNLAVSPYIFTSEAGTFDDRFVLTTELPDIVIGDVNGDGSVTIEDAIAIINKILNKPVDNYIESSADVNGDGKITIADAANIINIILKK